jgi:hypothetical protein
MRAILVMALLVFLCPASAMAQGVVPLAGSAPGVADSPSTAPVVSPPPERGTRVRGGRGGRDITRDEFVERAKVRAEKRFDQMDTNHDGILTAEERRAFRTKRQKKSDSE